MEKKVTIQNEEGLHARPAGLFVKKANEFKSQVEVRFGDKIKNGKSIMHLMSLGLKKGSEITIITKGEDEGPAVESLVGLVNSQFKADA